MNGSIRQRKKIQGQLPRRTAGRPRDVPARSGSAHQSHTTIARIIARDALRPRDRARSSRPDRGTSHCCPA